MHGKVGRGVEWSGISVEAEEADAAGSGSKFTGALLAGGARRTVSR